MIYLLIITLIVIVGIISCWHLFYNMKEYIIFFIASVVVGFLISIVVCGLAVSLYSGETDYRIVDKGNNIIEIQHYIKNQDYCDFWFFGSDVLDSEIQVLENK